MIGTTQTWKQTFTFDRYGNRRFDTANTTTLPTGCIEAVCNPNINAANNRLVGYQFDNAGNTTTDAENRSFIYDAENKQKEVKNSANQSIGQYFYDGDGKRVKKYVPASGETTIFVYDASGKMVAEYSTTVTPVAEAKVSYLTNDHLGSPRITTDANGNVISRRDFLPFGEEVFTTQRTASLGYQADTIREKFATYERDIETDLDFAQARYYAKNLGRFNSVDPLLASGSPSVPQSWNRYSYTLNSPLNLVDPTGLIAEDSCKQLGGGSCYNNPTESRRKSRFEEDIPLPRDVEDNVTNPLGALPGNWFYNKEYVGTNIGVFIPRNVRNALSTDATFFYNRGFQERLLFDQAMDEIRNNNQLARNQYNQSLWRFNPFGSGPNIIASSAGVGQPINIEGASNLTVTANGGIGTIEYGITLTYPRVEEYNSYIAETNRLFETRRETFVRNFERTKADFYLSKGRQRKLPFGRDALEVLYNSRVGGARKAGYRIQ